MTTISRNRIPTPTASSTIRAVSVCPDHAVTAPRFPAVRCTMFDSPSGAITEIVTRND